MLLKSSSTLVVKLPFEPSIQNADKDIKASFIILFPFIISYSISTCRNE